MDVNIGDIAQNGGPWGALFALMWVIGNRIVGAIDRLRTSTEARHDRTDARIEEHTKLDLAHHAEVREQLVEVRTMVAAATDRRWDDLTPVERVRPIARESSTVYHVRPGTKEK